MQVREFESKLHANVELLRSAMQQLRRKSTSRTQKSTLNISNQYYINNFEDCNQKTTSGGRAANKNIVIDHKRQQLLIDWVAKFSSVFSGMAAKNTKLRHMLKKTSIAIRKYQLYLKLSKIKFKHLKAIVEKLEKCSEDLKMKSKYA